MMEKTASLTLVANQSNASSVPVESFERVERECQQPVETFINLDDSLYDEVSESALDMSNTLERVDFILKNAPKKVKQEPCSQMSEDYFELIDSEQRVPNSVQDQDNQRFVFHFGLPLPSSSMIDKCAEFGKPTIPEGRLLPILAENSTPVLALEPLAHVTIETEPGVAAFHDITIPSLFLRDLMFNDRLINGNTDLVEELFPSRILERNIEIEETENDSQGAVLLEEDVLMASTPDPIANDSQNGLICVVAKDLLVESSQETISALPAEPQSSTVPNPIPVVPVSAETVRSLEFTFWEL